MESNIDYTVRGFVSTNCLFGGRGGSFCFYVLPFGYLCQIVASTINAIFI